MLFKRERYFEEEILTIGGTDKFDLPDTGFLNFIKLDFTGENANDIFTEERNRIVDRITEIRVSDGGTRTLFTLRGQEIKALLRTMQGSILPEEANFLAGDTQKTTLIVPFGRFLRDHSFSLDLDPWRQCILEITNDATAAQFDDGDLSVDIQLIWLVEPPARPTEYMKYFTWREDKPRADGQHVYHELPFDDPIFMVFAQLDPDLNEFGNKVCDPFDPEFLVKFTLDERTYPIWDHRPLDIARNNAAIYGTVHTHVKTPPSNTQFFDSALAFVHAHANSKLDPAIAAPEGSFPESTARFMNMNVGISNPELVSILFEGVGYYHTLILHHQLETPRNNWLDPKHKMDGGRGPVRLDVFGYLDDFTLRTCVSTPMVQGRT